jgi:hypothetical protein
MRLVAVAAVGLVAFAGVEYAGVAYPDINPASCATEQPFTTTAAMQTAGGVIHSLSTETPDPARVAQDTRGVLGVLSVWGGTLTAAMRGEARPAAADQWDARVVATSQQAEAVNAAACAAPPCVEGLGAPAVPSTGAGMARAAAAAAGFTGPDLDIAVAVAGAESSWQPAATNSNTNGSTDHGLWQINSVHGAVLASGDWADPYANGRMARTVWEQAGESWSPWVTFKTGAYLKHMQPTVAVGAVPAAGCAQTGVVQVGTFPGGKPGPWGGHENGRIPAPALCPLPGFSGHMARCDAAKAFGEMVAAYAAEGGSFGVTDSYRTYESQVRLAAEKGLYSEGGLAARPGTSNHGWGLAFDLNLDGRDLAWMRANAGRFGFVEDTPRESWHWGYHGTGAPA